MAVPHVSDKVDLKYCIPKLIFTKQVDRIQYFDIYIKQYSSDPEVYPLIPWQTFATGVGVNPDGSFVSSAALSGIVKNGKLYINNLGTYREYCIRFINTYNNREHIFKFKTGYPMTLKDSPYYHRVLFPEQNYDIHVEGSDKYDLPDINAVWWYYPLDSHKYEKLHYDEELYSSWIAGVIKANDNYDIPSNAPYNYLEVTDSVTNETIMLTHANTKNDNSILFCPFLHLVGNDWEAHTYYDVEEGGGGIALVDLSRRQPLCLVYIDSDSQEPLRCIYHWDNRRLSDLGTKYDTDTHYCYVYVNSLGKLVCTYYDNTTNTEVTETSTVAVPFNRHFILDIFNGKFKTWDDVNNELGEWQNIDISIARSYDGTVPASSAYSHKIPTPFVIGGPNAEKVYIGKFESVKNSSDPQLELKMIRPSLFKATIELSFHTTDDTTVDYLISNPSPKEKSIGFVVPKIDELKNKTVDYVDVKIVAQGVTKYSERLSGLIVGRTVIYPYTFPENYIYSSFDANFAALSTIEEKTTLLKEMFFTKHGTWGGYNGGVNGHNCYFNQDGVLVLENHGDNYSGSLKAVGKEGLQELNNYTGYGGDLYTDYSWDTRPNKSCLRVGTTLVSNRYFTFGKLDVWMKLPKGIYGVCPAIWFFHYIEVPEGDPRYNEYPYNQRVIQGSADDGYYRVVNNEIDIELPSHLTKGSADSFDELQSCYFDPIAVDNKTMIGIGDPNNNDDFLNTGLFQCINPSNPYVRSSWQQVPGYAGTYPVSWHPSFQNCKFNNWQGEYNSGDGWAHMQYYETELEEVIEINAEDYYKGTSVYGDNPLVNEKEEYLAIFQHLTDNEDGMADGLFHKWTIEWLPDRTVLYLDDVCVRVNKGFIPFNVMKLTIGTWFPTMPLALEDPNHPGKYKKCNNNNYKDAEGVYDQNGIYGVKRDLISPVAGDVNIGTWAGVRANWEICQVEISRVKYTRYNRNDVISTFDNNQNGERVPSSVTINTDPTYLGESYPESGLRWFDTQ